MSFVRRAPSAKPAVLSSPHLGRWALAGVMAGSFWALLAYAPAAWLAERVNTLTRERLLLADAQGTIWQGSALTVLTGGAGSRDASALADRLHWRLQLKGLGVELALEQACCIPAGTRLQWTMGWQRWQLAAQAVTQQPLAQFPISWFEGLGAPLNTLKPAGQMRLMARDLRFEFADQKLRMLGQADWELLQTSSRLSTLQPLGSYRVEMAPDAAGSTQVKLRTLDGALLLDGVGHIDGRGLHLRGQARAAAGQEAALNNLLNIIGRRDGAASNISIG